MKTNIERNRQFRRHALTLGVALTLALHPVASFARTSKNPQPPVRNATKTLLASEAQRECFSLDGMQRLHYRYQAEAPIEFKLLRQQGDQVTEVTRVQLASFSGDFSPRDAGDYCMTWSNNGKKTVTLRYWYQRFKQ